VTKRDDLGTCPDQFFRLTKDLVTPVGRAPFQRLSEVRAVIDMVEHPPTDHPRVGYAALPAQSGTGKTTLVQILLDVAAAARNVGNVDPRRFDVSALLDNLSEHRRGVLARIVPVAITLNSQMNLACGRDPTTITFELGARAAFAHVSGNVSFANDLANFELHQVLHGISQHVRQAGGVRNPLFLLIIDEPDHTGQIQDVLSAVHRAQSDEPEAEEAQSQNDQKWRVLLTSLDTQWIVRDKSDWEFPFQFIPMHPPAASMLQLAQQMQHHLRAADGHLPTFLYAVSACHGHWRTLSALSEKLNSLRAVETTDLRVYLGSVDVPLPAILRSQPPSHVGEALAKLFAHSVLGDDLRATDILAEVKEDLGAESKEGPPAAVQNKSATFKVHQALARGLLLNQLVGEDGSIPQNLSPMLSLFVFRQAVRSPGLANLLVAWRDVDTGHAAAQLRQLVEGALQTSHFVPWALAEANSEDFEKFTCWFLLLMYHSWEVLGSDDTRHLVNAGGAKALFRAPAVSSAAKTSPLVLGPPMPQRVLREFSCKFDQQSGNYERIGGSMTQLFPATGSESEGKEIAPGSVLLPGKGTAAFDVLSLLPKSEGGHVLLLIQNRLYNNPIGAGRCIEDLYQLCKKFRGSLFAGDSDEEPVCVPLARVLELPAVRERDVVFVMLARSGATVQAAEQLCAFLVGNETFSKNATFDKGTKKWIPKRAADAPMIPRFTGRIVICPKAETFYGPTFAPVVLFNK
jgi:hypothetical protein